MLGNDAVLVCEIRYGVQGYDRSYWTAGLLREVSLYADGVDFEDNYFEMLPGESLTIHWKSARGAFAGEIKVSSWNE